MVLSLKPRAGTCKCRDACNQSRYSDGDQENKRWFCSELVCAAFAAGGVSLFNARHWEISPGTLSICPLLHQV